MNSLILYTTLGCHLCEQALVLITPLLPDGTKIKQIDISESDELMERYGIRIPVLFRPDNQKELGWPFEEQEFLSFIAAT